MSPFVISSSLIDRRGVNVSGHVVSKDEHIVVRDLSWTRKLDVSVQYSPPDGYGVAFMDEQVSADEFDKLKAGDVVPLRYLLEKDLPDFPGATTLRQMHVLPVVRGANQHAWSGLEDILSEHRRMVTAVLSVGVALFLWRLFRIPGFMWAFAACVVLAFAMSLYAGFPTPTPGPQNSVRTTVGIVKSVERWEWLFRGHRQRGLRADQAIEIAGVQFIPEGRTEPVLAVDLIDDGSVPGLQERASVTVEYEARAPRVAHIYGATRRFPQRNLRGIGIQGVAAAGVLVVLLAAAALFSRGYRKLIGRRAT